MLLSHKLSEIRNFECYHCLRVRLFIDNRHSSKPPLLTELLVNTEENGRDETTTRVVYP